MNLPLPTSPILSTGTEWIIDAAECDPQRLRELGVLRAICDAVISDLGLNVVGEPLWHQFPEPGGVTGLYLLLSLIHISEPTRPY